MDFLPVARVRCAGLLEIHEQIAKKLDKVSHSSNSQPFSIAVFGRAHGCGRIAVISVGLTPCLLLELSLHTSNHSRNSKASLSWTGICTAAVCLTQRHWNI